MSSQILFSIDALLARPVYLRQSLFLQALSDSQYAAYGGGALSSQLGSLGALPVPLTLDELMAGLRGGAGSADEDVEEEPRRGDHRHGHGDDSSPADHHGDEQDDESGAAAAAAGDAGGGDDYDVEEEARKQERFAAALSTQEAAAARAAMIVGTTTEVSGAGTLTYNVYRVQKKGALSEDDYDSVSHPTAALKAADKMAYAKQLARWMNQHRKYTGVRGTPRKRWTENDNIIVLRAIKGARATFGEKRPARGTLGYQTHVDFWGSLDSAKEAQSVPEVCICTTSSHYGRQGAHALHGITDGIYAASPSPVHSAAQRRRPAGFTGIMPHSPATGQCHGAVGPGAPCDFQ